MGKLPLECWILFEGSPEPEARSKEQRVRQLKDDLEATRSRQMLHGGLAGMCHGLFDMVWVEIQPPGYGPQVLVHVSIYQGAILGTYY